MDRQSTRHKRRDSDVQIDSTSALSGRMTKDTGPALLSCIRGARLGQWNRGRVVSRCPVISNQRNPEASRHLGLEIDGEMISQEFLRNSPGTNLIVQVFLGFERQVLVILSGQHVGADADGEVAGVHLVDLGVAADQVEHGDQVLQQQQVGPGELIGNPGMKVREVGFRGG